MQVHSPRIAPSILSADLAQLGHEVQQVLNAGADLIHFDVMDNHYVPNLTFGPMVLSALRRFGIAAPMDVHLMVEPVDPLITAFIDAGATSVSFHPEASRHLDRSLNLIRSRQIAAGLVLNPGTGLQLIEPLLDQLDFILFMTVNPGFGGQAFLPYVLEKIARAKTLIQTRQLNTRIHVDGGINTNTIAAAARAGADTFIAGSAIFGATDYAQAISQLRQAIP